VQNLDVKELLLVAKTPVMRRFNDLRKFNDEKVRRLSLMMRRYNDEKKSDDKKICRLSLETKRSDDEKICRPCQRVVGE